jgi:aryl-alcohol dehydrogenase-like predicted oxidoreductase
VGESGHEESIRIIHRGLDAGVNFVDTADVYSRGESEEIVGKALKGRREQVVLATKVHGQMGEGPNERGNSRRWIIQECDASLRRLGTDWIDLYQIHRWDPETAHDETLGALTDLVRAGKVRYIGFSDTPAWKVAQAQTRALFEGWSPLIALQIEYSLIERTVEGELIPMAIELGLGVTPWSPLRGGVLSGKYTRANAGSVKADRGERVTSFLNERTYTIVDELTRIGRELAASPASVALAWVQSRPGVASTIIGARRIDQLEQNLAALDVTLSLAHLAALNAVSEPSLNFPGGMLRFVTMFTHGGMTVNGVTAPDWPLAPKADAERY